MSDRVFPTASDVLAGRARWSVESGDSREWVSGLPPDSVHCVVTSPPYFGLRDYGASGQIGLEKTPVEYVGELVKVFRGVRRALHPSGVLWLNLGDSYNGSGSTGGAGKQHTNRGSLGKPDVRGGYPGLKPKDLIGIPWRVSFALQEDGWYLRSWLPWVKRNAMTESAGDRPGSACEVIFLLTKSPRYFFDMGAVRKQASDSSLSRVSQKSFASQKGGPKDYGKGTNSNRSARKTTENFAENPGRNFRNSDLWFDSVGMLLSGDSEDPVLLGLDVPVVSSKVSHYAMFPPGLVLPLILSGTSARGVCPSCGDPWRREVETERVPTRPGGDTKTTGDSKIDGNRDPLRHVTKTKTVGWRPGCGCSGSASSPPDPVPAVVMDPFAGSGVTLAVAVDRNRRALGCELNPDNVAIVRKRMSSCTESIF